MIKVDFHTHSVSSPDGGISAEEYTQMLNTKKLDCIAITDHDCIDFAIAMNQKLGNKIIVGQEVTTNQGEIIGLFLTKLVTPKTDIKTAVAEIKNQGGLVYIPHPFETVRKGITKETLNSIKADVDIVEAHNGRAFFQNKGPEATVWARLNNVAIASSSDAHGIKGLASSFTNIKEIPNSTNLLKLLELGRLQTTRPPFVSLFYPKYNRLRGKLSKYKSNKL